MSDASTSTPADRIDYAIRQSGKTLEQLAAEIGCSHAALSQWRSGATNVLNIKAGLLQAFAERTNCDLRWLLTGNGPVISRYSMTSAVERVATALQAMERTAPLQVETVIRMVEAAASAAHK